VAHAHAGEDSAREARSQGDRLPLAQQARQLGLQQSHDSGSLSSQRSSRSGLPRDPLSILQTRIGSRSQGSSRLQLSSIFSFTSLIISSFPSSASSLRRRQVESPSTRWWDLNCRTLRSRHPSNSGPTRKESRTRLPRLLLPGKQE